jgi:hypothetical protein
MSDFLGDRRKALEDSFFAKRDRALLDQLHQQLQKEELSKASGITDDAVLESLVAAELGAQTITALSLVPLVATAWADGKLEATERDAIVAAIEGQGIQPGSIPHKLLEHWLSEAPGEDLVVAWKGYIGAIASSMPDGAATALRNEVLGRAKNVAQAAGGILGLGSISNAEQEVLDDLESAFPS